MLVIGLAGGTGSGKGAASQLFSERGLAVVDTDAVYAELTAGKSECLIELAREFGEEIISENGSLNRTKLADLVFSGEGKELRRAKLNAIAHRHILAKTRSMISRFSEEGYPAVIIDAPLLFESGFDKECDITVCVIADTDIRISRIMARDGILREAAERRIAAQIPNDRLVDMCDHSLENNGELCDLSERVDLLLKKIFKI